MNKKLYLHIGCGKTGSSALQVWLDHCCDALLCQGVYYPKTARGKLGEYQITSGNGGKLFRAVQDDKLDSCLDQVFSTSSDHVLFSSEQFQVVTENQLVKLRDVCQRNSIDVVIIAYIRDLYDWAYSSYLQAIKRHGYGKSFEDFLSRKSNFQPIDIVKKYSSVFPSMKLIHYDTEYACGLEKSFAEALGLGVDALPEMQSNRVNRSLTVEEASLMLAFNRAFPLKGEKNIRVKGADLSDQLIYQSPETETEIYYSPALEELLRERFQTDIDWINTNYLREGQLKLFNPSGKRLAKSGPQVSPETECFVKALIDITQEENQAAKSFGVNSLALRNQNIRNGKVLIFLFRVVCRLLGIRAEDIAIVKNPDSLSATAELDPTHFTFINTLRNEAIRRESESLEDAFILMKAAAIFRKNGPVIQQKITEYREKIKPLL